MNNVALKFGKERSAIRELAEKGMEIKRQYGEDSVYDFSIGNPSIPGPKIINDEIIKLIEGVNAGEFGDHSESEKLLWTDVHGYTANAGDPTTRKVIADNLNSKYGARVSSDLIMMTNGASASLAYVINAIIDKNKKDEIIVFGPFFSEYRAYIENAGATLVMVDPDYDTMLPDLTDLKNKINSNTRIIIINSPNNPTGLFYKEALIKDIVKIVEDKQKELGEKIYILSDEPYREILFSDEKYPFITNYYKNSIVTYSYSKSLSLPGERIGYILVNNEMEGAEELFEIIRGAGRCLGHVCASSLYQKVLQKVDGMLGNINAYKENAELLYNVIREIGFEATKPEGAFYFMMKALEPDDKEFSKKALEEKLLIVPSASFGITGYVRMAFCTSKKQILASKDAFKRLYDKYKK